MIYQQYITRLLLFSGVLWAQTIPTAPINIGAYGFTETTARLSFKDLANNEEGFRIYHQEQLIATVDPKEGNDSYQYKTLTDLTPCTLYTVNLVAYNEAGESAPLVKSFRTIGCELPNQAPLVSAGENQNILLGERLRLEGIGLDTDGEIVSYVWKKGEETLSTEAAFEYQPTTIGVEVLTLTVTDDDGASATDEMKIFINDPNSQELNVSEAVNILDFGAIPDDDGDDTDAIEHALSISGHITMPKGLYRVEHLTHTGTTIIDGNGSTFLATRTDLGTSSNILTLSTDGLEDKIQISNLTLDGNCPTQYPREGDGVASLLHIYDAAHITLENIFVKDYSSQYYRQDLALGDEPHQLRMNNDHALDMFHAVVIAFSSDITIKNYEQSNIKIEGPLIYESDNIVVDGFRSTTSNSIWTALHVMASDNIRLTHVKVSDGLPNSRGSSINFVANYYFELEDVNTTNKDGFDISNEVVGVDTGRVTRDTSFGTFRNCRFEGYHPLQAYPTKLIHDELSFINSQFIPSVVQDGGYNVRFEMARSLHFEDCTFGSPTIGSEYQMILGNVDQLSVEHSTFINTQREGHVPIALYFSGADFGEVSVVDNNFSGVDYTPILLRRNNGGDYGDGFNFDLLHLSDNHSDTEPLFVNTTGLVVPEE